MLKKKSCLVPRIYSYNILIQQFDFIDYRQNFIFYVIDKLCTIHSTVGNNSCFDTIITEYNSGQKLAYNFKKINSNISWVSLRKRKFWIFLDNCLYILFLDKNLYFIESFHFSIQSSAHFWVYRNLNFELNYKYLLKKNQISSFVKFCITQNFVNNKINFSLTNITYWIPQHI